MAVNLNQYPHAMDIDPKTGKPMPRFSKTGEFVRKSTDPKPAGAEGNSLYLWDTKEAFIHDGIDWRSL